MKRRPDARLHSADIQTVKDARMHIRFCDDAKDARLHPAR
ncbi:hypothetical protein ABIF86_000216 [Bradyrhizobium japonicum]